MHRLWKVARDPIFVSLCGSIYVALALVLFRATG
jgi:hypothetical protein